MHKKNRKKRVVYRTAGWAHLPTSQWVQEQQDKPFVDLVAAYRAVWPVHPPASSSEIMQAYNALADEIEARGQNRNIVDNLWIA